MRKGSNMKKTPTLSELIEACGDSFHSLSMDDKTHWVANWRVYGESRGSTPEEAVAKLYIALNKKHENKN